MIQSHDKMQIIIMVPFQDIHVKIKAVVNDSIGTLMSCAWKKGNVRIGMIVGELGVYIQTHHVMTINHKVTLRSLKKSMNYC